MAMILATHIIVALASIGFTGWAYARPSAMRLRASYALVAATLVTGAYLVIANSAHLVSACVSGLAYLGVVSAGIAAARWRLASVLNN